MHLIKGGVHKMKFFVCGGTGYIGSKVITKLVDEGHRVCCVKREKSNILNLPKHNIEYCENNDISIEEEFKTKHFDWVLNMACSYSNGDVLYSDVLEANMEFPLRVLNIAVNYGVKNFLTIGTGLPGKFNMYSFSKAILAEFGKFYSEKHGINFYSLELEMFYGPNEPRKRFLPSVIDKMCNNDKIELTVGTQKRDIVYIDDVIAAIVFIIHCKKLQGFQVLPVGSGNAPQIYEVINYLRDLLKSNSELQFGAVPMRAGEPDCVADMSVLRTLGFEIKYQWKDGLKKMLEEEKRI